MVFRKVIRYYSNGFLKIATFNWAILNFKNDISGKINLFKNANNSLQGFF